MAKIEVNNRYILITPNDKTKPFEIHSYNVAVTELVGILAVAYSLSATKALMTREEAHEILEYVYDHPLRGGEK